MKVVYIADVPIQGGATESLVQLTLEMRESFDVEPIVCTAQESSLNERLGNLGIENHVTGHAQFLFSPPGMMLRRPIERYKACKLYHEQADSSIESAERSIDFSGVDLIHSNLPRTDLGEELSRRHGIPHICHLREFSFEDFKCESFREKPEKYISDNSRALIAVSNAVRMAWARRGADIDKIHVVYNGVKLDRYHAPKHALSPKELGKIQCVFLGGCSEAKGIWDALEAIRVLRKHENIHLDVYGWDSRATKAKAEIYIKLHGLTNNVSILNRDSEIAKKLNKYNLALVCSRAEGFGRVVLEYQASGVPVVAADTGALPEIIKDEENGLLYKKSEGGASLSDRISEISSSRELWHSIRSTGLTTCRKYSSSNNTRSIIQIYRSLLSGRNI